jgi:hypothetical protein
MREWTVNFRTMERKDRGKEIILENGGKITEAHQKGIFYVLWYVANDEDDVKITELLENEGLIGM